LCIDLSPNEDFKSSVLAGLRPELVLDICGRAIAFWIYQVTQETYFQHTLYKKLDDKCASLTKQLQSTVHQANAEIAMLKDKLSCTYLKNSP
jgi:E3 ubiquitin-protein ligase CCNP1IP1